MLPKFFKDATFVKTVWQLALPIMAQQFLGAALNALDVLMVGQLGQASIAALGLANQVFFVLNLLVFGITSGSAIFTAQYWGKGDLTGLQRVLGTCLTVAAAAAGLFTLAALFMPEQLLRFYTNDPEVIELGSQYLRFSGLSCIPMAITYSYQAVLRSTRQVRMPLLVSGLALGLKSILSYGLIFGALGLPRMDIQGGALATTIARALEMALLLGLVYGLRTPAAASLRVMFTYDVAFFRRVFWVSLPAAVNELVWALGITTYNAVYARIGTDAIAAVNINASLENLAFVVFIGLAHACAIMIGNSIGAGQIEQAQEYSRRFFVLGWLASAVVGAIVLAVRQVFPAFYNISPAAAAYSSQLMLIFALTMWVRVTNLMMFIGVLRSGGDTRFALVVETSTIWLIGVPAALVGGFVLHLPVTWVYGMVLLEEAVKGLLVLPRYRKRAWIHHLAQGEAPT